jgi:hypothetical protein
MLVKSVVIFDANGSAAKLACARIEPDNDVVRTVSIQTSGSYSMSKFMREVREILGAPEWMVISDASKSRQVQPGDCEHLTLRFMGKMTVLIPVFHGLFKKANMLNELDLKEDVGMYFTKKRRAETIQPGL